MGSRTLGEKKLKKKREHPSGESWGKGNPEKKKEQALDLDRGGDRLRETERRS